LEDVNSLGSRETVPDFEKEKALDNGEETVEKKGPSSQWRKQKGNGGRSVRGGRETEKTREASFWGRRIRGAPK